MTLLKIEFHKNGDSHTPVKVYECNTCYGEISDMWPRYEEQENNYHLCISCGFKLGKLSERFYLDAVGIGVDSAHAAVNENGKIQVWFGIAVPPWRRSDKEQRNTVEYRVWRTKVFERDDYTCQDCEQRGGELNAHHIKPFAKYKDLRFEVSNGVTLCIDCHKEVHKKRMI